MALSCGITQFTERYEKHEKTFDSRTGHHTTILPNGFTKPFGSVSFCTDFGLGLYLVFILNLWSLSREFGFFAALYQKAVQSVSLPDTVTINVKGTQETDGLIYITARGTITNLTVTRLKVN